MNAEILVPKNLMEEVNGLQAPPLNRWRYRDWQMYSQALWLAGYKQALADAKSLPQACRDCTCIPILDGADEAAVEISKNCPIHGERLHDGTHSGLDRELTGRGTDTEQSRDGSPDAPLVGLSSSADRSVTD
jgi:hypothetical protein